MNEIMERIGRETLIGFVVGLVVGLIIGLPILGWWVFPVQWYDADPFDLRQSYQEAYISMLADSYTLNTNVALARQRVEGWDPEDLGQVMGQLKAKASDGAQAQRLDKLAAALGVRAEVVTSEPAAEATTTSTLLRRLLPIIGIVLAAVLVIAGVIVGMSVLRGRRAEEPGRLGKRFSLERQAAEPDVVGEILGRFVANYVIGKDSYDESFSIESPTSEFLGECGMGISEIISAGPPASVTAFEVWLFDKNDIRTVTKVLMSKYAYHEDAVRAKLAAKGEAVLVGPGKTFVLETASLRVDAEIIEMGYDEAATPPQLYFTRLMVSLTPSLRTPSAEAEETALVA
ncbi:MAG: hypothetical protein H8E47_08960 [Anaerolineales bacterium]|nr:hypothetical protein [Anaerolineales bacterium]